MAAFCSCCGAEISLKPEACAVCGTPQHGMVPTGASLLKGSEIDEKLEPQAHQVKGTCCSSPMQ